MIQNGDIPISKERMLDNARFDLGLPKFTGIEIPAPMPTIVPPAVAPGVASPFPSPAAGDIGYAITPPEHMKYHELFLQYDTDKDGFLSYEEAIGVLSKSKVDPIALQTIWYCLFPAHT